MVAELDVDIFGYGYTRYTYPWVLKKTHFGRFLGRFESFFLETFNTFEGNLDRSFDAENRVF